MLATEHGAVAAPLERFDVLVTIGLAAFVATSHVEAAVGASPYSPALSAGLALAGLVAAGWTVRVARKPSRGLLLAGAAAALALVALWAWTRTIGVPFGAGRVPIGLLDAATAFDELLLAAFALAVARGARRTRLAPGRTGGELAPMLGAVAISLSFIVLAIGCDPARTAAADGAPPPALICHLY